MKQAKIKCREWDCWFLTCGIKKKKKTKIRWYKTTHSFTKKIEDKAKLIIIIIIIIIIVIIIIIISTMLLIIIMIKIIIIKNIKYKDPIKITRSKKTSNCFANK